MKKPLILATLVILTRQQSIVLGIKKGGMVGKGKVNAPGGKVDEGESLPDAAMREVLEEVRLRVHSLKLVAVVTIHARGNRYMRIYVYRSTKWSGVPGETEEMRPLVVRRAHIPYHRMLSGDRMWFGRAVGGRPFNADVHFLRPGRNLQRITFSKFNPNP